jgi:hypothetical protein
MVQMGDGISLTISLTERFFMQNHRRRGTVVFVHKVFYEVW